MTVFLSEPVIAKSFDNLDFIKNKNFYYAWIPIENMTAVVH